jgi:hypothetical protein
MPGFTGMGCGCCGPPGLTCVSCSDVPSTLHLSVPACASGTGSAVSVPLTYGPDPTGSGLFGDGWWSSCVNGQLFWVHCTTVPSLQIINAGFACPSVSNPPTRCLNTGVATSSCSPLNITFSLQTFTCYLNVACSGGTITFTLTP